jgi:hypothetical protein
VPKTSASDYLGALNAILRSSDRVTPEDVKNLGGTYSTGTPLENEDGKVLTTAHGVDPTNEAQVTVHFDKKNNIVGYWKAKTVTSPKRDMALLAPEESPLPRDATYGLEMPTGEQELPTSALVVGPTDQRRANNPRVELVSSDPTDGTFNFDNGDLLKPFEPGSSGSGLTASPDENGDTVLGIIATGERFPDTGNGEFPENQVGVVSFADPRNVKELDSLSRRLARMQSGFSA